MKDARHTTKLYTVVSYLYETSDKTELVTKNRSVPGTDGKKLTTEGHIRRHDQSFYGDGNIPYLDCNNVKITTYNS